MLISTEPLGLSMHLLGEYAVPSTSPYLGPPNEIVIIIIII